MTVVPLKPSGEMGAPPNPPQTRRLVQEGKTWPVALIAFLFLAVAGAAGVVVVLYNQDAGLAGLAFLASITLIGAGLFYVWLQPARGGAAKRERLRFALADQLADAICVTNKAGAVVISNAAFGRAFREPEGDLLTPDAILAGNADTAARVQRLVRAAADGQTLTLSLRAGIAAQNNPLSPQFLVTVQPFSGARNHAVWRFAPIAEPVDEAPEQKVVPLRPVSAIPVQESDSDDAPSVPGGVVASVFGNAPIGIAIADAEGKIIAANAALEAFAHAGAGALAGLALSALFLDGDVKDIAAHLRSEGTGAPLDVRLKGETPRTAQLFGAPLGSGQTIVYVVDTTEQKAIELQFAQSQKMQAVGQLAGGVAHDFNNLLTVVLGFTELLLQRHKPGDPSFADLQQIKNNASRAARLVGQLLAFSRRQVLQPKVFFADELLNELTDMLRRALTEEVRLATSFTREGWPIKVDEVQFSNMVMNLALNAKDAMPKGGTVSIRTENVTLNAPVPFTGGEVPRGDYVLIEVTDTGTGIPKEIMGKIFEPFFTTKGQGKGTGLGLSMVYGFVKQSGGFIFPESEAGKGTTFRIYLPRYQGAEQSARVTEEAERVSQRDLTGAETILLVEDEDPVRSFATRALSMRGYTVLEANGGERALEIVHQNKGRISLLVTDVIMPGMDGPTLAKRVKEICPDLKVIFISGYAEDAFKRADEKTESIHFLPKPFTLKQLAAKVKDVLEG